MGRWKIVTTGQQEAAGQIPIADGAGGFAWSNPFATIASSQQSGSYTFALADAGTVVEGTSSTPVTFTIPLHVTVPFLVGTLLEVFQDGLGQITIAGASGVTLVSDGGKVNTAAQYATVGLRQRTQDQWVLSGDLA